MHAQPPTVDLGTGGLPAGQGAPSPVQSEIPEHYIENDAGHNAEEAVIGTGEGVGQLLWDAAKANLIEGATLGLRKKWTVMLEAGRGLKRAWESGDWAGFFDTAVDIFNQNYNPLYAAGEHGYYAYNSKKAHDWRGTFRHGTIAVIIGVLTVVTTAKGVAGAAKKGTGAVGIGAAEEAGTKAAAGSPSKSGAAGGPRAAKPFTKSGKKDVIELNKAMNEGKTICSQCGIETLPAQQSRRGITPPSSETQIDHIIPRSKSGDGAPLNGQLLCRSCNRQKGDQMP